MTRGDHPGHHWGWVWAWAGAAGLLAFSVVAGFGIGLFVLPLALVALWYVARSSRLWPDVLGAPAGIAGLCFLIAAVNANAQPCPAQGAQTLSPGESSASCGGRDPLPWLVAGAVLVLVSASGSAIASTTGTARTVDEPR